MVWLGDWQRKQQRRPPESADTQNSGQSSSFLTLFARSAASVRPKLILLVDHCYCTQTARQFDTACHHSDTRAGTRQAIGTLGASTLGAQRRFAAAMVEPKAALRHPRGVADASSRGARGEMSMNDFFSRIVAFAALLVLLANLPA